jgi:hypothetical protein
MLGVREEGMDVGDGDELTVVSSACALDGQEVSGDVNRSETSGENVFDQQSTD